jgi:acylpyruvate hydrolase
MRYFTFSNNGEIRLGALSSEGVVDIRLLVPDAPETMREFIASGDDVRDRVAEAVSNAAPGDCLALADCHLLQPITDPGKIICLGLNFADHAKEGGHPIPDYPAMFMRSTTSMIGPNDPMILPRCSEQLDWEAELTIVIGKHCRDVKRRDAANVIFGYTAMNDGSIRDYQRKSTQWTAGKNFDGTGALGPCVVTADELPEAARGLKIETRLNGAVMQSSTTDQMIFDAFHTVEILSEIMTLEPGDLIAMGTPSGVGHARRPQVWMKAGDLVEVEIEGIGKLSNPVVAQAS